MELTDRRDLPGHARRAHEARVDPNPSPPLSARRGPSGGTWLGPLFVLFVVGLMVGIGVALRV